MIATELFHPMLVHFPIVLLVLLALTDLVALARGVPLSGRGPYASVAAAVAVLAGLSAIVTWIAGDAAMDIALEHGVTESLIETHEGLGTTTAVVTVVWALIRGIVWWRGFEVGKRWVVGVTAVDVVLVALVVTTAWAGGSLVYEHGVNVRAKSAEAAQHAAALAPTAEGELSGANRPRRGS